MRPGPALLLLGLGLGLSRPPPSPGPRGASARPPGMFSSGRSPRRPVPARLLRTPRRAGPERPSKCPPGPPARVLQKASNSSVPGVPAATASCQLSVCSLDPVKIHRNNLSAPIVLYWNKGRTFDATVRTDCQTYQRFTWSWQLFRVASLNDTPDWTKPLSFSHTKNLRSLHIPRGSLVPGVYVLEFTASIYLYGLDVPDLSESDWVYVQAVKTPLKAVLLGAAQVSINFADKLVLDATPSSDPDADVPSEGLRFSWYCTTNQGNYVADYINVTNKDVCHPGQETLDWRWGEGPVLTLPPETLKGNNMYFFRVVVKKDVRASFSDKTVQVLQGQVPVSQIECVDNCASTLVLSDRFSLFLKCMSCGIQDSYQWYLLSKAGKEVEFDWAGQTLTGRNGAYLSFKAFAFRNFSQTGFFASLHLSTWSGVTTDLRYPFVIDHGPTIGRCQVDPGRGVAMFTKFVIQCHSFQAKHIPLMYKMIVAHLDGVTEFSSIVENTLGTILYWGKGSTTPPSFLPVGVAADDYNLKIYVQVYDSLGTFSQVTLQATVEAPTSRSSSEDVLQELLAFISEPTSVLSALIRKQDWLAAGYFTYVTASVLNEVGVTMPALEDQKAELREHLVNRTLVLPVRTLEEIGQMVVAIAKLTQDGAGFTQVAKEHAALRLWQASKAVQAYHSQNRHLHAEQVELVNIGLLAGLSNILKLTTTFTVFREPFLLIESLLDTVLDNKGPGSKTTTLMTTNFNMYVEKVENWNVARAFINQTDCQNCFHATLNTSRVPDLPARVPVSLMFCEFANDPFPWLSYPENISTKVVGFRMMAAGDNGSIIEITPDIVEVFLARKHLMSEISKLVVGPGEDGAGFSKVTTGGFSFEVDSKAAGVLLVHIVTEVTVPFRVLVYAGDQISPANLLITFFVPHDVPPIANPGGQLNVDCVVKEARSICLPLSLLQVVAQRSQSPKYNMSIILQAPRFALQPTNKLVGIALSRIRCLDMYGIQNEWQEGACVMGEKTTWDKVHCICRKGGRSRRQLHLLRRASAHLHTHFVNAKVIVIPNPVDLHIKVIKTLHQNPVTFLAVLFIMFLYIILAFWVLHRGEMDHFLRNSVVVLPDNDPYDNTCYLVTIFTGSRCGAGTKANVFVQLKGTEGDSNVHCLSHPYFVTLYRGGINTFLLTTKSDLGDIHSIRVWHDNEGKAPSWYLSRIKVENIFSKHIWLFMCRKWLSIDTTLDMTFPVTNPEEPLRKKDFFLIDMSHKLLKSHMWFSIFAGTTAKSFNRFQKLSCCLATLLSSLMCNIMFFNLNKKEQAMSKEARVFRSMMIGIESVLITIPVQLLITFFFTYSQKKSQERNLSERAPRKHPLMSEEGGNWKERLEKWYDMEKTPQKKDTAPTSASSVKGKDPIPPNKATLKSSGGHKEVGSRAPSKAKSNMSFNNNNVDDDRNIPSRVPSMKSAFEPIKKNPKLVLPWWCVYIAWFLVFATSGVASFFIVFYGLTYGYDKSVEWLLASFCSFCQSVFLVQPCKLVLLSGMRTNKTKYYMNLSWSGLYRYTEIKLDHMKMLPQEMQTLHDRIETLRASRMYQPLMEDEIQIFRRKRRIRRRALLFLSYLLTHFIFLALLLLLIALLRHKDSFYHNQFIRRRFSVDLAAVTKLEDVYRWLHKVPLPLLHNHLNPTFLPDSSSKILGLPLMRQVRAKPRHRPCLPTSKFGRNSLAREIRCHPEYGIDPEDTDHYSSFWNKVTKRSGGTEVNGFTYRSPEKKWRHHSYGVLNTYGSGGYAVYFFPERQMSNATQRLQELQRKKWLDEKTWAVILELTTLNLDAGLICSISVVFEVSPLGVVNSSLCVYSFALSDFNRETSAEIYLYTAILIFFLAYVVDEIYVITQERALYSKSVYNLLNFALKCIFTVLIVLFFRKHFMATRMIHSYLHHPPDFIPFHSVSHVDHAMRVTLAFLLFLTILKTLRYSRFFYDVRLAQRAIQAALPGICHMAFVVSVFSFVYMAFGYLVFGQHEWNYSSMIHATQTIFSYCVSAFQNTEFSSNKVLGVLFLLSFMLVMICILINLFQAVILSAYDEMKQPVYEEPSEEAEAISYLCGKLRTGFGFLSSQSEDKDQPGFFVDMLYGQPEKNSHRYLGLKTRNINGKKMVYLVV